MIAEAIFSEDYPGSVSDLENRTRRVVGLRRAMSGKEFAGDCFDEYVPIFVSPWFACMTPHDGREAGEAFVVVGWSDEIFETVEETNAGGDR